MYTISCPTHEFKDNHTRKMNFIGPIIINRTQIIIIEGSRAPIQCNESPELILGHRLLLSVLITLASKIVAPIS